MTDVERKSGKERKLTTDLVFEGKKENKFAKRILGKDLGFGENSRKVDGILTEREAGPDIRHKGDVFHQSRQRVWLCRKD